MDMIVYFDWSKYIWFYKEKDKYSENALNTSFLYFLLHNLGDQGEGGVKREDPSPPSYNHIPPPPQIMRDGCMLYCSRIFSL